MVKKWWQEAVFYQIYPRSFADSNGDGIGDLAGITGKLDYLNSLGVDVLWLSPIYRSPNDDNGYDISDYYEIMTEFGTMADFDRLLKEIHRRGMRLVMDLVINHTSDEHPWFLESRSSKLSSKRDFYIWRPGRNGNRPNNWGSFFSGPAWELDDCSGEYYLHLFSRKQPDLNWENPEVKKEIFRMIRWWLDKGIDGFRMDVINLLVKPDGLPDAPGVEKDGLAFAPGFYANQPGMHMLLQEMNRDIFNHFEIVTIGECARIDPQQGLLYTAAERRELDLVFQFDILRSRKDAATIRSLVGKWYDSYRGRAWNTITLSNHDSPRQISIYGDTGSYRKESAKLIATFLLTAPGTPFLYQGEEIGMSNVCFEKIEDYRDIEMLNRYRELQKGGKTPAAALGELQFLCRDNARTPMQWDDSPQAGFTNGQPWIKVNSNYLEINVGQSLQDPDSILEYYRSLIKFRKGHPDLVYGEYLAMDTSGSNLYVYRRSGFLIVLNWGSVPEKFSVASYLSKNYRLVLQNYGIAKDDELMPWESRLYQVAD